jgi:hypothetical protein
MCLQTTALFDLAQPTLHLRQATESSGRSDACQLKFWAADERGDTL